MAQGIQDLGTGGWLYKTLGDGVTIISTEPNTISGVQSMQQQGTSNAPVVASRPAVGTITVSSVAAAGSITAITIAAVNQIGSNIVVASAVASVVAGQIATAINSFTPASGDNFTAQAVGAVVYVFSSPSGGSAANGEAITVSVTDPSIVTVTTDLTNGSSEFGLYDTTFGYRFWIDANYNGTASPTVLTYAQEITQYMTVRGLQSGIITVSSTVNTDRIIGLTRACAITQILTDTQGAAATDVCAFIQTEGFVEGDEIRLRCVNTARVTTLEDATVTTSPIATKNIYLTDASPFALSGIDSITLQLTDHPSYGVVWVETGRSLANSVISTTIAGISTLISTRALKPGASYLITDIGDAGCYVFATDVDQYNTNGLLIRRIPKGYVACWQSDMAAPAIGSKYRYYNAVYTSVNGTVGTAPDASAVWTVVAKTSNTYYEDSVHEVGLNDVNNLGVWPIIWERDLNGNFVSQSSRHNSLSGVNAFNVFQWNLSGLPTVCGNQVIDSVFDCGNTNGSVYQNTIIGGTNYSSNKLPSGSVVAGNLLNAGTVTGNYLTNLIQCNLNGGGITNNGGAGAYFYQIANCIVQGSITGNTSGSAGDKSIEHCHLQYAGIIRNNVFYTNAKIRYTSVGTASIMENSVLYSNGGGGTVENCRVTGSSTFTVIQAVIGNKVKDERVNNSTVTIRQPGLQQSLNNTYQGSTIDVTVTNANHSGNTYNGSSMTFTDDVAGCIDSTFNYVSLTGTPTIEFYRGNVTGGGSSNLTAILDLDDAAIFAANILTIPSKYQLCGGFYVTGTGAKNIQQIVDLPLFSSVWFLNQSGGASAVTFTKVAPGAWSGDLIVGAANFVLTQDAAGPSDYIALTKTFQLINTIIQTAKLA